MIKHAIAHVVIHLTDARQQLTLYNYDFSMHLGISTSIFNAGVGQVVWSYRPSLENISVGQQGCKYLVVNSTYDCLNLVSWPTGERRQGCQTTAN